MTDYGYQLGGVWNDSLSNQIATYAAAAHGTFTRVTNFDANNCRAVITATKKKLLYQINSSTTIDGLRAIITSVGVENFLAIELWNEPLAGQPSLNAWLDAFLNGPYGVHAASTWVVALKASFPHLKVVSPSWRARQSETDPVLSLSDIAGATLPDEFAAHIYSQWTPNNPGDAHRVADWEWVRKQARAFNIPIAITEMGVSTADPNYPVLPANQASVFKTMITNVKNSQFGSSSSSVAGPPITMWCFYTFLTNRPGATNPTDLREWNYFVETSSQKVIDSLLGAPGITDARNQFFADAESLLPQCGGRFYTSQTQDRNINWTQFVNQTQGPGMQIAYGFPYTAFIPTPSSQGTFGITNSDFEVTWKVYYVSSWTKDGTNKKSDMEMTDEIETALLSMLEGLRNLNGRAYTILPEYTIDHSNDLPINAYSSSNSHPFAAGCLTLKYNTAKIE